MEVRDGVKRLLARKGGISVQNEWLDACISWIVEEEVSLVSICTHSYCIIIL